MARMLRQASGILLRLRLAECFAGRSLAVCSIELGADRGEPLVEASQRRRVCALAIPVAQLRADAAQRARAALVEHVRLRGGFIEKLRRKPGDRGLVLRRELDQRREVAGTPLQTRRRSLALL